MNEVENIKQHYKWEDRTLYFRENISTEDWKEIPKVEERRAITERAQSLWPDSKSSTIGTK
jgi:hypothetical protein